MVLAGLSSESLLHFYNKDNMLYMSCGDSVNITADTKVDIAKDVFVSVDGKGFISYINYLSGFKLGGDVSLVFGDSFVTIKYVQEGVSNYVDLEIKGNSGKLVSGVRSKYSVVFSTEVLSTVFPLAITGTSSMSFSNAYNGLILFKYEDTIYLGGTDTIKCVVVPVDVEMPEGVSRINISTVSANILSNISKLLSLPCTFRFSAKKFMATIGIFTIVGPLLRKGAMVESLLGIEGGKFKINRKLLVNGVKGAVQATKKDIYSAINIRLENSIVRLKTKNFEVALNSNNGYVDDVTSAKFNSNSLYSICNSFPDKEITLEILDMSTSVIRGDKCIAYLSNIKD